MKTVAKHFDFLAEAKQYEVQDIIDSCEKTKKKLTSHENIMSGKKVIEMNYELMQLYSPMISYTNKKSINYSIKEFEYDFNKINFVKMLRKDGQGSLKFNNLYAVMNKIRKDNKGE